MRSGNSVQSATVARLFSDPFTLQVPSFQRPFAWEPEEAAQLLNDLLMAMEENSEDGEAPAYFLGTIVLLERDPPHSGGREGARGRYDIIDGQQRIVTLTILIAVLRDLLRQIEGPRGSRRALDLDRHIAQDHQADVRHVRVELRDRHHEFFAQHVQNPGASSSIPDTDLTGDTEERLLAVREHFLCELIEADAQRLTALADFVLHSCEVALIVTHSVERAHRIFSVLNDRGRPLERNDILKAEVLGGLPPEARDSCLAIWDRLAERLGDRFEDLFSHIRTIEGRSKSHVIGSIRALIAQAGGASPFVTATFEPYALAFDAIRHAEHAGSPRSAEICRYLRYLGWFGSGDWVPPALLWWCRYGTDADRLADFLKELDRLAFCLRLLGLGNDKRGARFNAVLHAVRAGEPLQGSESPLELAREERRNILHNLRGLHTRSQLTCKLVLMRLNDELAGAPQGLDPGDYTVEHVLPQKPTRSSQWRSWFPVPDERETCTQSLGNLVLVTRQQNERARNLELARKLEIYGAADGMPVPYLTRELLGRQEWRAVHIQAREERLLSALRSVWRLDAQQHAAQSAPPGTKRGPAATQRARAGAARAP